MDKELREDVMSHMKVAPAACRASAHQMLRHRAEEFRAKARACETLANVLEGRQDGGLSSYRDLDEALFEFVTAVRS